MGFLSFFTIDFDRVESHNEYTRLTVFYTHQPIFHELQPGRAGARYSRAPIGNLWRG